MRYVKLGQSGLEVSQVAIGAMNFGDPERGHPKWSLDEEKSRPLIEQALESGINFFDTANLYSQGTSEEILGQALRDFTDRTAVVVATKIRHPMRSGPNGGGLSRKAIFAEVDNCLRRLGMEYVDILQIHRLDYTTPYEETLEALHDVVKAGKALYLGASSMRAWEFSKLLHMQKAHGWARFISMQDHYNLLAREEEHEMLPLCLDEGIGNVIWSPLARGRLARVDDSATARAAVDSKANALYPQDASDRAILDAVGATAARHGVSRAQIALAWFRHRPGVIVPLVGPTKRQHIEDAVASLDVQLTDDELQELEAPYTPRIDNQGGPDEAVAVPGLSPGRKPTAA